MKDYRPEVVAWRWRKPVVNNQGETVGATAWELSDAPGFLPWWQNVPLIRLSDYHRLQADHERLQAECEKLRKAIRRLCNIFVVDDYYSGDIREERLNRAVERAIDAAMQGGQP